jgi:hypothetical protein
VLVAQIEHPGILEQFTHRLPRVLTVKPLLQLEQKLGDEQELQKEMLQIRQALFNR